MEVPSDLIKIIDKIIENAGWDAVKNGKVPTMEQKKVMKAHGLIPENWLVVKNLPGYLEVVSRASLKKVGGKPRIRTILKRL